MKVLIADPDWRFAQQATSFLESHANLVVHDAEPRHAVTHARRWKPDLAIVSAELVESGIIEALTAMKPAPAVLVTEHMARFDRAWRAWQRGGDELLLKPVLKANDILVAIRCAMQNAASGARPRRRQLAASA
ncbi:MAG: PleD family two-component system response regulator [Planctomycetota bacterium]|jgi:DNA-binding response OmpR family regulator